MSGEQLNELDYSFHIDGEDFVDEAWANDPEVLDMLAEIDKLYEGVEQ